MGVDVGGSLPNTFQAAQFSLAWLDIAPAYISDAHAQAYKAALKAKLPAGAPPACRAGCAAVRSGRAALRQPARHAWR